MPGAHMEVTGLRGFMRKVRVDRRVMRMGTTLQTVQAVLTQTTTLWHLRMLKGT